MPAPNRIMHLMGRQEPHRTSPPSRKLDSFLTRPFFLFSAPGRDKRNLKEEIIIQSVRELPEFEKSEVLDFIQYLRTKIEQKKKKDWADFSLSSAMRGMEEEQTPYSLEDIKESF